MAVCQQIYPGLPATERGRGILIAGDVRSSTIAYTHGRLVILRNLEDPYECDVFREHTHTATVARFSPSGEWVASGDASGMVKIWSKHGDHKVKFELKALSGSIDDLQWSADSQRIVVCGDGKGSTMARAFMWDSGNNIGEFDGHSKRVLSCSFRPVRPFKIVTCGEDMLVNFYEGPPFRFKSSHRIHKNFVNCIRFSPDGSKFISVSSDYKVVIFDGLTGEKLTELADAHSGSVYAVSWSPDGKQVLTVSGDKTAKIWDISASGQGKLKTTFTFAEHPGIEHMQVGCLWLGRYIITVSLSGLISYLDLKNSRVPSRVLSGHSKFVTALAVVNNEGASEIYSSSYDGMVVRWRIGEGCLGRLQGEGHRNSITGLIGVEGELVSCGLDDTVRRTPLPAEQYDYGEVSLGVQPTGFDVAAKRPELVIVSTVNGVTMIRGMKVVLKMPLSFQATAAGISPDGTEAAVGGADGHIRIYEVRGDGSDLVEQKVLERHRGHITIIRYSKDGKMLASGDQNREVVVWDRPSHEVKIKNMVYHNARVTSLAWAPDSIRLATGSIDMSIILWDTTKSAMSRVQIKGAHQGAVTALGFKDPVTLVSGGDDTCLRIWKLPPVA